MGRARFWGVAYTLAVILTVPAQAPATEVLLHSFGCCRQGASLFAGVILDPAGNIYGTALSGGAWDAGVVYKLDLTGHLTVLYSFKGGVDGGRPYSGVIRDSAGNLYGTTYYGGMANAGVVYKLSPTGQETVLYSFTGGPDGANPIAEVILDSAGNLYGTTYYGGTAGVSSASGAGVVFKLDPSGQETVLYSFTGEDGANPDAGVIRDAAGNLYGTTFFGGKGGNSGVVYKLDPAGVETVLHHFTGGADGGQPASGLVGDSAGNLYGTTSNGGAAGYGVVYKLDSTGQTVLYHFTGAADGANPEAGVIRDSDGNLYGTTYQGGTAGVGVVYKLDLTGQETVLHSFTSAADGANPEAGIIRDSAGDFYGTTYQGGNSNLGIVYKLDPTGEETVAYNFKRGADGFNPTAGVILDSNGNLYGTTKNGGWAGRGIVYKLDSTRQETVLYSFTGGADGDHPFAGVVLDSVGNLYGTTHYGGTGGNGVVYKVDPAGQETVLYRFTGGADGAHPIGGVILDSAGNLYGTTAGGGTAGNGVVYKLDPTGQETVLHSFKGTDGASPRSGVIRDSAGNLYGTTKLGGTAGLGVVYKVDLTGRETVLHDFSVWNDGQWPEAGVVMDSAGNLYGTTFSGADNRGIVYKLDPTGLETVLHIFSGGPGGAHPLGGVILDPGGNLYGTTYDGGTANVGVVYKLDPTGKETVLHSFSEGTDGRTPFAGVVLDSAGNLYGTTYYGGNRSGGVVFMLQR
jgi:uncharacterized repeat protein (TIGR03803 family)